MQTTSAALEHLADLFPGQAFAHRLVEMEMIWATCPAAVKPLTVTRLLSRGVRSGRIQNFRNNMSAVDCTRPGEIADSYILLDICRTRRLDGLIERQQLRIGRVKVGHADVSCGKDIPDDGARGACVAESGILNGEHGIIALLKVPQDANVAFVLLADPFMLEFANLWVDGRRQFAFRRDLANHILELAAAQVGGFARDRHAVGEAFRRHLVDDELSERASGPRGSQADHRSARAFAQFLQKLQQPTFNSISRASDFTSVLAVTVIDKRRS